jgi:glycosyltransferase involved in cell wall biosynthesis
LFFKFINYIAPGWYFNIPSQKSAVPYIVDFDSLTEEEKGILEPDMNYSSEDIRKLDLAYQAWHKGIVKSDPKHLLNIHGSKPSLNDEYHFVRKYYKSFWSVYILLLRILSLKNPLKELSAFFNARKTTRVNLYEGVFAYRDYPAFESDLLRSQPMVSVIIPTLNRYTYLDDVLKDLELQDYKNFEVIIIDQAEQFRNDFYENRNLRMNVIRQGEKALWLARNTGVKTSLGEYLLFYDDDSRIDRDWISQHLKALDYFNADISSGVSISVVGAKVPAHYGFIKWADQLDTGNFMIRKEVFKTTGLFDRQFERQRMGDGEFGLRCYLAGFKNISNPNAKRIHLKVSEGGLRQMGSWDAFRPKKLLSPRPIPSVNYFLRKYFGNTNAIYNLLINVPPSVMPYRFKKSSLMMVLGSLLFLVFLPFLLIPVIISWRRSSIMLIQKARIEFI